MRRIAYVNGEFVPIEEARVSILDRGFLFADGIYEVTAVLDGRLVDNDSHLARLERSCREIRLPLPLSTDQIEAVQKELVERNNLRNGMVYLQVTRGTAERNFLFPKDVTPTLVMFTQEKDIANAPSSREGISVACVDDIRWGRRDIKSVALLAQVLAKQIAAEAGCDEAWMIEDGYVTEGGSSTAFIITEHGALVTRSDSSAVLPGCTAKATLQLVAEMNLTIERRPFTVDEALQAREAFMTSASTFVQPIVRIDGRPVADGRPGPLSLRLRELYIEFARTDP
ncbi:D-amino-acid transaminase [Pseudaminobacter sp. 19-2017]|uniref:Probable branched-chain-amino-acid aminotransferase n=1 Tax=Pseudaminobacter soli (ex Zhang et al. 2022) TaxID=2831468 RepID=A0A942I9D2_9HYPH|nr:D-amino-acid transaminase [Pseudaminobacter soli]MBS3650210.1 D-amino-acid transaminase [Pseudaminobacter soli]